MERAFILKPLTEEMKSAVRNYFSTGERKGYSEAEIRFMYGRMRRSELIENAEVQLKVNEELKQAQYKKDKEIELQNNLEDYRIEHDEEYADYEIVRYKQREDTDSLTLGVIGIGMDGKPHRFNTIEVVQKNNPIYFQEVLRKYRKENQPAVAENKPF